MTRQQKIWKGMQTLFFSVRPLLLYLFVPGILMSIGMLIRRYGGSNMEFVSESGNFYNFVSCILILLFFYRRSRKKNEDFFTEVTLFICRPDRKELIHWGLYLLFGASAGLFVSSLVSLLPLPSVLIDSYSVRSSGIFHGRDWVLLAVTVGILAPFTEEIVFRGYMLNRLLAFFNEKEAVVICSAVFGLCHVSPIWVLYAFAMGMFLGWLAIKQDNILYAVIVHMGFNLPSVLISAVQFSDGGSAAFFGSPFLIFLYGVIGAASGKLVYSRIQKREEQI